MIRTNRLEYVGTQFDPKSLLGTVGVFRPVDYTIINGRVVVQDGKLCTIDEEEITARANLLVNRFIAEYS